MIFHKSHKAFFFTGAVAILLVLLIASTMTWVAVSNARSERAPLITQGQQVQNMVQSVMGYQRALQVSSETAFYQTNLHMRAQITVPNPSGGMTALDAKNERYTCIYPDISPTPDPLCDIAHSNDPIYTGVRNNVIKYFFCDTLATYAQGWRSGIRKLGNEMGLDVFITEDPDAEEVCKLSMSNYRTVKVEYKGTYEIRDKATGQLLASGKLPGEAYVDINGYEDPAIWDRARKDPAAFTGGPIRNIYFSGEVGTKPTVGTSPDVLKPDPKVIGMRGKGWFYGKTISDTFDSVSNPECVDASDPNPTNLKKCIVVIFAVSFSDPNVVSDLNANYGGVILLNVPEEVVSDVDCDGNLIPDYELHEETEYCLDCLTYLKKIGTDEITTNPLDCPFGVPQPPLPNILGPNGLNQVSIPFIAADYTDPSIKAFVDDPANRWKHYFIGSKNWSNTIGISEVHNIWDIEKLRATAVCGFYMNMSGYVDVNNQPIPDAPDFLQRMTISGDSQTSPNGIESFLVGVGVNDIWNEGVLITGVSGIYSNADHAYLEQLGPPKASPDTFRMKGMPGCRELDQCSYLTPAGQSSPVGHFAIDYTDHLLYDPFNILQCNPDSATSGYHASCDDTAN
ncbi:MAG: hypothetical protein Q7T16_02735 [Candidatus Burarchaeum sp.]|nr:hypothetical protein [Candidatus Burarchaeum sp.]